MVVKLDLVDIFWLTNLVDSLSSATISEAHSASRLSSVLGINTLSLFIRNHNTASNMANPENPADNLLNASKPPRLLEAVRDTIRLKHYSLCAEETYVHWIRRFIHFHGKRRPRELGAREVTAFLNHLVTNRDVAAATQNQALSALLFLYREVLAEPLAWLDGVEHAKRRARTEAIQAAGPRRQFSRVSQTA